MNTYFVNMKIFYLTNLILSCYLSSSPTSNALSDYFTGLLGDVFVAGETG